MKKHFNPIAVCSAALVVLFAGMNPGLVNAQDIQNSVLTLEELLKIDNAQALAKSREEAQKLGMFEVKGKSEIKTEAPLPVWKVRSVFGRNGQMNADIAVDGVANNGVAVGAVIGSCTVKAIESACVALLPLNKKARKGMCPQKICWTGDELSAELQPQSASSMGGGSRPMPSPLPPAGFPLPVVTK